MRNSGLIIPNKNIKKLGDLNYGLLYLDGDTTYSVYIKDFGTSINPSNTNLVLSGVSGSFGGQTRIRKRPPTLGYKPRSFSSPFRATVAFDALTDDENYFGQSDASVKEFIRCNIEDTSGWFPNPYLKNPKFIGFGNRMFLLADKRKFDNEKFTNYVHVWEWNAIDLRWDLLHVFTDYLTDSNENAFSLQEGSPDACVFNDELIVCFRIVTRSENNSSIVSFALKEDNTFEFRSKTFMDNSELEFDDFRVRCASTLNSIMIAFYGVALKDRGLTGGNYYVNDMRTMVSFNGGYEFESREKFPSSISGNRRQTIVSDNRAQSSIYSYFIKDMALGSDEDSLTGWNVKFDLYYDKDMGCYVILKGGSVDYGNNLQYLIGIKTRENDLFSWEKCVEYRIDMTANGDVLERNSVFDEEVIFEDSDGQNAYNVLDVDIIDGLPFTTCMLNVEQVNSSEGFTGSKGTAIFEFRFVTRDLIPNGNHDKIIAFGAQSHEDYIFVTTPINKDYAGISCCGTHNEINDVVDPRGCIFRNQIVMSEKKDVVEGYSLIGYPYMIFSKPWSNVYEKFGYEFCWSGFDRQYAKYGLTDNTVGTGTIAYDTTNFGLRFDTAAIPDKAYVSIEKPTGNTQVPTLLERASSRSFSLFWKAKMKISFDSVPADRTWFLRSVLARPTGGGFGLRLRANSAGEIEVFTEGLVNLNIVNPPTINPNEEIQLLVGINANREGNPQPFLFWRSTDNPLNVWQESLLDAMSEEAGLTSLCEFGIFDQTATGTEVLVTEFQLSTYGSGYRDVFHDFVVNNYNPVEGTTRYTVSPQNYANPFYNDGFELYSNEVSLYDGSVLEISGYEYTPFNKDVFELKRSVSRNSLSNISNEYSHYGFNFSDEISSGTYSIIFQNEGTINVDTLALYNLHGVYSINLRGGDWDGSVWTNDTTYPFSIPRQEITATAFFGNTILVSESFEEHSLEGHSIMVFDNTGFAWVDQYIVVFNSGNVIKLHKAVSSIANMTFALFSSTVANSIPADIRSKEFFEIEFLCPSTTSYPYIGEVLFGTLFDTSRLITSVNEKVESIHDFATTDNQLLFPKNITEEPVYRTMEVSCVSHAGQSYEINALQQFLEHTFKNMYAVGFVNFIERGGQLNYLAHVSGKPTVSHNGFLKSIDFSLTSVEYSKPEIESNFLNPPIGIIRASNTSVVQSQNVTFIAIGYTDTGLTLSYDWNFGDGVVSNGLSVVHAYASEGTYQVTCQISDGTNTITRFLTVDVTKTLINVYDESITALTSTTDETITFTAKDASSTTVTDDSFTQVRIIEAHADLSFDADLDLTYDNDTTRLVNGVATFGIKSAASGVKTFKLQDSNGFIQEYQLTFT